MSWGLKVWSPEGYTIIDGSSRMLRLHQSGSVSFTGGQDEECHTVSFPALSETPVVVGYWDPYRPNITKLDVSTSYFVICMYLFPYSTTFYYWVFKR